MSAMKDLYGILDELTGYTADPDVLMEAGERILAAIRQPEPSGTAVVLACTDVEQADTFEAGAREWMPPTVDVWRVAWGFPQAVAAGRL